jgi:predicted DNA-binding transcriptional regulator YafY
VLDKHKLRILPDSLRLQPAQIDYQVLGSVLRALATDKALKVSYCDRSGKRTDPVLHPLGIIQRGPRVYLFAMKNDESDERMYALDRISAAECLPIASRSKPSFDLDLCINDGRADFASGEILQFKAEVRGYIEQLLYDCPLNCTQNLIPVEDGEGSLLTVEIPSSGQLLRWVLAGGENLTVLEPENLRVLVVGQAQKVLHHYQDIGAGHMGRSGSE